MTTASWSTVVDQSTDAAFRTWGSELSTKFAAVGMVQTADTGQINWSTVTRAAINTAAGYEIWRLSGSALYFKIEYGSGSATTTPSLWITVGTGSNGSGTLTGQTTTRTQTGQYTTAITSTSTLYQSYLCATADYFGLSWKIGSTITAGAARAFIIVARTVDNTGAATTLGYQLVLSTNSASVMTEQAVSIAGSVTGALLASQFPICLCPGVTTVPVSSSDGAGNAQAFLWWWSLFGQGPVQPLLHAASVLATDLAVGVTASMTLVGSSAHTYLAASGGYQFVANFNSGINAIMLYE